MNPGKQAHLRTVLLATTALVGVVLIDGGSASAGQAAGCAPAGATAGTITCAPQTDNYNPGGVSYQPTGPLMLSIAPGATVTGVTDFGASVQVSGPGAMFSPDPVDVNVSISNAGTLAPSNSNTFGSSGILGSVGANGSASTLQINNSGTINNASSGSPDVSGISASVTGNGAVTVTNSGQISAVQNAGNGSAGVEVGTSGAGTGTASVSVVNSGAISSISGDYGVRASSARGGITISNQGTITGSQVAITATTNNGGGGIVPLSVPAGTAAAGTILIDNAGRIVSTATNNPIAIQLGASNNTLLLEPGQSIVGAVQNGTVNPQGNGTVRITTGVNTLNLGGAGTDTFDVSQIGLTPTQQGLTQGANGQYNGTVAAAPTQQYQEFSSFVKSGSSTWILTYGTGSGLADQNWGVTGGTLQGDTTSIRGATITDGAALAFVQNFDGTYAGTVVDGAAPGALVKGGAGTLTLTGANTYTGGTFFSGGAILATADANLGGAAGGFTFDGGALRYGASFDPATTRAITLNAGGGTLDTNGFNSTVGSTIAGPGALTKLGTGTLTLTGANTYAGGTLLQAGTLAVGGGSALGTGTLAFNGGTLQAAANATLGNAVALNTAGTIDTQSFGLTATGVVSGPGALTKLGTGTLTLTGANTYAGGTLLKAGTLAIGDAGGLGIGTLSMRDGTTLAFTNSLSFANAVVFTGTADPTFDTGANAVTAGGSISGAGALTKQGSGMLVLNGVNTYTGGTTIAAGTLRGSATSFGTGAIADAGSLVIDQTANRSFANAISGTGSLVKTGAGTLTLTGESTLSGPTTVQSGGLVVQGSLGGSTVTIANGGTLSGTGRVGAIAAQGGAAVAPGTTTNPYGVLRVAGSVAFAQGSTFTVSIDPTGRNSAIAAGGTASLSGGTVAVRGGSGTYDPGTRYTLLTADKGISGAFSALSTTSNLAFLNPFLSYGANDVYLGFTRNQVAFLNVGITRNQRDTGTALQALGAGNPLYNAVLGLTAAQARAAFDASSGEIHASAVTAGFEDTRLVREAILNRLQAAARDGVASRTDGAVASDLPPTFVPTAPYTLWGQGFGDFGYNGTDRNAATLERSLGGFVLGGDMLAPSSLGPWRFGVAGGYTEDTLTLDKRASSGTFQTAFGALYAGAQYGALDLKFGTSFGGTSTSTNRLTAFPGLRDGTTSNYDGAIVQGFGEAGYRFLIGNGMVEPLGTGAFIHIHQDGFREDGGPAALVGTARDYDLGTTTLGLKGEMPLMAGLPLYASGFLGWRHAFGDLTPGALLQFGAGTTPFEVFGAPVDRDALSAQVAVDYRATSAFTVGVSYSGQVGERAEDQAVRGRVQYRF